MGHIKTHYFTSHPTLNTYAIIPKGLEDNWWEKEHDRQDKFPAAADDRK
jgi:putative glutathione S-transferase